MRISVVLCMHGFAFCRLVNDRSTTNTCVQESLGACDPTFKSTVETNMDNILNDMQKYCIPGKFVERSSSTSSFMN